MKLTFITGNDNKAKYLSEHFHIHIDHVKLDLPEIQSLDLEEIVRDKAVRAFEILKTPVLVEDVSLEFRHLKGLPGPLIKWFLKTLGNDGICNLLDSNANRSAVAEVIYAICDETGVRTFKGTAEGSIPIEPRGGTQFGWDPIFIPQGQTKTRAEMTDEERHQTSMRKPALEKISEYLKNN